MKDGLPKNIRWAKCQGRDCGKRILYAEVTNKSGLTVTVPLDPVPACYHVAYHEDGSAGATRATRNRVMVSHFITCPNANEFSGGKR